MSVKDVIVGVLDQWAQARGNHDVEYALCKLASGKEKVFENDEKEFEDFIDNREAYWTKHGWSLVERNGRKTLTTTP